MVEHQEIQTLPKTKNANNPSPATSARNLKTLQGIPSKDPETIQQMFGKIANRYDLTNSVLSLNMHKRWNKRLVSLLNQHDSLLDLCSGTGEIAYMWLKANKKPKTAILLDFCEEMLDQAKSKSLPYMVSGHTVRYMHADATSIPLPPQSVDSVSMAYGIRNVQEPVKCFQEVYRVLKPQGTFLILELTEPRNPLFNKLNRFYLNYVLPFIGGFITKQPSAYKYLSKSIQTFTKPVELHQELLKVGFKKVSLHPLSGGLATIIEASK